MVLVEKREGGSWWRERKDRERKRVGWLLVEKKRERARTERKSWIRDRYWKLCT